MFQLHRCNYGMGCYCGQKSGWRCEGLGVYYFSTGSRYEGNFKDGMFHGKGILYFTHGGRYKATWFKGRALDGTYHFKDGMAYESKGGLLGGWRFCNKLHDRRFYKEITEGLRPGGRSLLTPNGDKQGKPLQEIPDGCYDVGDGYLDPEAKVVYNYNTKDTAKSGFRPGSFLKSVTSSEKLWIMKKCRQGHDEIIGNPRTLNYEDIKKISKQAGERAIKKVGTSVLMREDSVAGTALRPPNPTIPSVADVDIQEMLKKYGNNDAINKNHKPRKVFWSRYFW